MSQLLIDSFWFTRWRVRKFKQTTLEVVIESDISLPLMKSGRKTTIFIRLKNSNCEINYSLLDNNMEREWEFKRFCEISMKRIYFSDFLLFSFVYLFVGRYIILILHNYKYFFLLFLFCFCTWMHNLIWVSIMLLRWG